jgi:hypothetical protein
MSFGSVFIFLVLAGIAYGAFTLFTKKGKAILFGGRIIRTIEGAVSSSRGMATTTLQVHVLDGNASGIQSRIGLEISSRAFLSASMMPVVLSREDALKLAAMLQQAAQT